MKKILLGVAAMLFIASAVLAQPPHQGGIITGRIAEDSTNIGIPMAMVTATKITGDPFVRTAQSMWDGHYGMHQLPAGSYVVSATKPGWSAGIYPETLAVDNDLHENIDIYLTEVPIEYGSIAGIITDASTSAPIENANVVVQGPGPWNSHYAQTGADGTYLVDELMPGAYTVSAHKMGYLPGQYPDPVEIDGNDTTGIDIALAAIIPTGVRGTVTDLATGNPIEGARVEADDVNHWHNNHCAFTDINGDYEIDAPPGEYHMSAVAEGYLMQEYPTNVIVPETGYIEDIDFALGPIVFGSIAGIITDASTTAPIENANVIVRGPGFWNTHYAQTGADGAYLVDELLPGAYTVSAHKEGYFPGQYPDPVEIDGNDTTGIDIALAAIVPTGIRGTVTDFANGNPIEGARVHAVDVNYWHHHRWALTDVNGDYEIDAPPGEYHVTAVAEGFLMEEYPTNVIIPETGYVEDIDFALTGFNFGSISGAVTDTAGNPIENARIIAWKYGDFFARCANSDETGAYTIENLIPGDYRVHAHKWGFEPELYPDTVEVPDGGNVPDIDFVLVPFGGHDGVISGTVTDDSTGLPIEGASLVAIGQFFGPWFHCLVRRVFTDVDGNYSFENLPEMPFKIFAHAQGYLGEFYDNVQSYFDATPVTPDAENINIALAARADPGIRSIFGRIFDQEGRFIDGGIVYLKSDGQIVDIVDADIEGYYGFSNLQPGIYEVSAFTPYGEGALETPVELIFNNYGNADIVITVTSVDEESDLLPEKTALGQNYPNPFNAHTAISFSLQSTGYVDLSIYNIVGQKIVTLLDDRMDAGEYDVVWDGRDNGGAEVASGIYYYRLTTANYSETRRMTLLK